MTTVVNLKYDEPDVYIGRGSIFGNPYVIGRDGTREEVIARYKNEWFPFLLKDKIFKQALLNLKDKKIGCFCKSPHEFVSCHGDVIKEWLDNYPN